MSVEAWAGVPDRGTGFGALYRAELPRLLRYGEGVVGDPALAADLVQEAFARLFARWYGVREPREYLFLVLTNLIRNHWRSIDRERSALERLGCAARPASDAHRTRAVRDAVERLPARLREAVLLHYFADAPVEDVAERLGRPLGTVKRHLHEARRALAAGLAD